ncbi:hypothetical protein CAPTEDRAFT_176607 [Capitella teleta]|uniref:1-phosphatidylinositol-3-phosphate 5-kinase n=1 Tax=Capitella teleta TaxID=283909 RepID=R7UIA9_CAPTE|nr:hypothetical protein CAPTEDRAFT_176607 [Capitella teleta]|eukprot:ELU02982.1 hypothetical protein CAPTEDRAFT_176607 [Capitella teleta]
MAANMNSESLTTMTEFAPLSSEVKPSGNFISRLFRRNASEVMQLLSQPIQKSIISGDSASIVADNLTPSSSPSASPLTSPLSHLHIHVGMQSQRTLTSVLSRLSNILDRRSQTPQAYRDSDFRQYWMPDNNCRECYECGDRFNTFRRRHHCRICGQIFCSRCCNQEVPGSIMGYTGFLRVCTYCCRVVLSYAKNPDASVGSLSEDLASLDCEVEGGWVATPRKKSVVDAGIFSADESSHRSGSKPVKKVLVGEARQHMLYMYFETLEESEAAKQENRDELHGLGLQELWRHLQDPVEGVELQSHRHRLRTFPSCMVGSHVVDWLITQDWALSREQAIVLGQALVDARWLECVTSTEPIFRDEYALYKHGERANTSNPIVARTTPVQAPTDEPLWLENIQADEGNNWFHSEFEKIPSTVSAPQQNSPQSIFYVDRDAPDPRLMRRQRKYKASSLSNAERERGDLYFCLFCLCYLEIMVISDIPEVSFEYCAFHFCFVVSSRYFKNQTPDVFNLIPDLQKDHMIQLTNQLLQRAGLPLKWAETILPIVNDVTSVVQPNIRENGDSMDIRRYVQIKKIPGSTRCQCRIIPGVVCTKNIAHKKMRAAINEPRILLLRAPVEYQRVEQKLSSLDPQILQEYEHLRKSVGRIAELKPDILMVEKTVSRLAQDFLLEAGITLVLNVKQSVLERVSRFTGADIISSIDGLVSIGALGTCPSFSTHVFSLGDGRTKTLMYFDGLPAHLGCTVTLRGGSLNELRKVKRILTFLCFTAYHSRLETSFLMDEVAVPPSSPETVQEALSIDTADGAALTRPASSKSPKMTTEILDQSDPLHNYLLSKDDTIFMRDVDLKEERPKLQNKFKKALEDVILSISPLVKYSVPYLESNAGSECRLRSYFSRDLYQSALFSDSPQQKITEVIQPLEKSAANQTFAEVQSRPTHAFVDKKLTSDISSNDIQRLVADFRARGGCLHLVPTKKKNEKKTEKNSIDCLDPERHQHISVLFSGFSYKSINYPNPCVAPWVVNMDFYGRNDMTLGLFLERYCFRDVYKCSSEPCDTAMVDHVRRFAHGNACLQVNAQQSTSDLTSNILMWGWCKKCKQVTPVVPMSLDTWNMSFGKFLELRFYANAYGRRAGVDPCEHSLHHDHYQYYGCKQIVASFRYSPIQLKEIFLPPIIVSAQSESWPAAELKREAKTLNIRGTEVYSSVSEHLHKLKQNGTDIPVLNDLIKQLQVSFKLIGMITWSIDIILDWRDSTLDGLRIIYCVLFDAVGNKTILRSHNALYALSRAAEIRARKEDNRTSFTLFSSMLSPSSDVNVSLSYTSTGSSPFSSVTDAASSLASASKPAISASNAVSWAHGGTSMGMEESTSEPPVESDKKSSVKNLLSSLLSSGGQASIPNPFPCDQHHLLPPSDFTPVVIHDQEPSSIIAYALSSADYENQLEELRHGKVPTKNVEEEEGERERTTGRVLSFLKGNREKSPMRTKKCDIESVKYTPQLDRDSVDEAEFSDSASKFYCRIYFAEQFKQLRLMIFPQGEERFIQSLSRCFTWMARGGKSGSSFCKTQDDRFILKQMSRYELQSFSEFAPGYFEYITEAHRRKQPIALAKILGVYRIGFHSIQTNASLKQDLLVMENLFFDKKITQIFDLKGSMRNRLVSTSGKRVEDLVLLDENLLKLSVDSPLYLRPHSKVVLNSAIMADTDFLSQHLVMDYSLLVGLDEDSKELVVGIIDYIRTFTWDKKLEFVVKTTYSHLGGQGKMPTVVSPELYRTRFLEAMNSYFLLVPDKWTGVILADQSIACPLE